jgi:hypothetical protein
MIINPFDLTYRAKRCAIALAKEGLDVLVYIGPSPAPPAHARSVGRNMDTLHCHAPCTPGLNPRMNHACIHDNHRV